MLNKMKDLIARLLAENKAYHARVNPTLLRVAYGHTVMAGEADNV